MTAQLFGALLRGLIAAVVVIAAADYLLRWLYRRSTRETALVRTGYMGEKVIINGGVGREEEGRQSWRE